MPPAPSLSDWRLGTKELEYECKWADKSTTWVGKAKLIKMGYETQLDDFYDYWARSLS